MSEPTIVLCTHRGSVLRLLLAAPIILALCLASLTFSASAQAAGASAVGWGDNPYGETGNGAPDSGGCTCRPVPVAVIGLSDATQISGGDAHTLALHSNGTVTAWGYNAHGQLGNGTSTESATPVPVSGLTNVVAVDAGYEHNLALLGNGTVMAWGHNYGGELGVGSSNFSGGGPETCGTFPCSKVPIPVPGLSDVVAIDAGFRFSLALLADGTVRTWGYGYYGQLGDGTGIQSGCECVDHPVPVPGVTGAMAISLGEDHGMALLGNGTVTAWGENFHGQIGNGTTVDGPPPACICVGPVAVNGLSGPVQDISAGGYHSVVQVGGIPQTWGLNYDGELGNGSTTTSGCQCIPTPGAVLGLSGVQSVAAGYFHTLALLGDGSARAWGNNSHGSLGDGTETDRSAPVPVSMLSGASSVSTGGETSFALIGPSHTLTVLLAGAGAGTVGGPARILCPAVNCVSRFPNSQVQILRAEPAPGTGFAGFSGACTGTGACQVKMDADQTVTATFGPPKGTKITRAKIRQGPKSGKAKANASRKSKPRAKATFSFTAPGAVTGYQCMLVRPRPKRKKGKPGNRSKLAGKKRVKPRFSKCSSPKRYRKLRKGRYRFRVRALNILGADAKPAVRKFRIRR